MCFNKHHYSTVRPLLGGVLVCIVWLSIQLSGCANSVKTVKILPPNVPEAAEHQRVALIGFQGKHSKEVNVAFETMLVKHRLHGRPYFTVVDRTRTRELMREYKKSLSGVIDHSTAAKFGKQIGASGVYFGDVTNYSVSSKRYKANKYYCKKYASDGKKCEQSGTRKVTCTRRTANITLVPRLIDVETSQVVYRAERTGSATSSACPGQKLKSDGQLLKEAIVKSIAQIRADIAPNAMLVRVELMDEPSQLTGADAASFNSGMDFAKAERMDRACQIWRDLNRRTQSADNALLYNVAVCEELEGNYSEALNLFEQVDQRLMQPDDNVSEALTRLRSNLQNQ
jgi:hypothetical protein